MSAATTLPELCESADLGPAQILALIVGEEPAAQKRLILKARAPGCALISDTQAEVLIRVLELGPA